MHELSGTLNTLRAQSEQYQRRVRELEEQIESDDRAEKLEGVLQNTQDRAAELEFQVSKLKQVGSLCIRAAGCSLLTSHRLRIL